MVVKFYARILIRTCRNFLLRISPSYPRVGLGTRCGGVLSPEASVTTSGSQGLWSSENKVRHRLRGDLPSHGEGFVREQSSRSWCIWVNCLTTMTLGAHCIPHLCKVGVRVPLHVHCSSRFWSSREACTECSFVVVEAWREERKHEAGFLPIPRIVFWVRNQAIHLCGYYR